MLVDKITYLLFKLIDKFKLNGTDKLNLVTLANRLAVING